MRLLGRAAQLRLNRLNPGATIPNAMQLASVTAYHAGEMIAGLQPMTRLAMSRSVADQLAAGINSGQPCDCPNCRPRWGERS